MKTSDNIADLAGALAKAQGAFENPAKDRTVKVKSKKTGTEYSFSYATFAAIVDAVRRPLADNGLSFMQLTGVDEHGHLITTRLLHASGQWMEFDTPVFVDEPGSQAFGSGVTYAKRYALSSMLGITADEDDDGNASQGNEADMRSRAPMRPPQQQARPAPAPAAPARNGNGRPAAVSAATNDEAAETFTTQSIEAIGKMKHQEELAAWWRNNSRHIERLGARYPTLLDRLTVAADEMRDRLPHVTEAA